MNADDITRLMDELAKRLGPAGEWVFEMAVRQVYIDALLTIGAFVVALALTAFIAPRVWRWVQDDAPHGSRDISASFAVLVAGPFVCLLALFAFLSLADLLNPEYAALRALLGAIR